MDVEDLLNTLKKVPDKNIPISTFGGRVVKIQFGKDRVILITAFINKYLTVRQCAQQLLNCDSKWNVYVNTKNIKIQIILHSYEEILQAITELYDQNKLDFNNFKH